MGHRHSRCGHSLGGGEHGYHRVFLPRRLVRRIPNPSPQINDFLSRSVDRHRGAYLFSVTEICSERVGHRAEPVRYLATNGCFS